jgi:Spy/CpxP family protein refolding chaperone
VGILLGWLGLGISQGGEVREGELDLSPQQTQALRELRQEFQREQQQIRQKILEARLQLRTLSREEYAGEKGEALRREIRTLMLQARERALFYRRQALQLLTPEQLEKIGPESSMGFHCGGLYFRGGWDRSGSGKTRMGPPSPR